MNGWKEKAGKILSTICKSSNQYHDGNHSNTCTWFLLFHWMLLFHHDRHPPKDGGGVRYWSQNLGRVGQMRVWSLKGKENLENWDLDVTWEVQIEDWGWSNIWDCHFKTLWKILNLVEIRGRGRVTWQLQCASGVGSYAILWPLELIERCSILETWGKTGWCPIMVSKAQE